MKVPLVNLRAQYGAIKEEIQDAIDRVLQKQQFIQDTEVRALEEEIAAYCGTKFAVACANGTDALLLSLLSLNVQPQDEVITTAYSFFSSASVIAFLRLRPVFVDVEPSTFNLDPAEVFRKLTRRTRAVIAVHLFGQCCRIEELLQSNGVPIIEDAAQAIGALRQNRKAGSFGIAGCFSFFPTKNLGAYGDGGMITTNDHSTAEALQRFRNHGEDPSNKYRHLRLGTNSRLDELQAAVLRVKLKYLDDWNVRRQQNASFYNERLHQLPLELPKVEAGNTCTYHQYVICTEKRDALRNWLQQREIQTAVYYPIALPLQPCFSYLEHRAGDFPRAEHCAAQSVALPVHPELSQAQLEHVVNSIESFFQ